MEGMQVGWRGCCLVRSQEPMERVQLGQGDAAWKKREPMDEARPGGCSLGRRGMLVGPGGCSPVWGMQPDGEAGVRWEGCGRAGRIL